MKYFILSLCIGLMSLGNLWAQFEGDVTLKTSGEGDPVSFVIKGKQVKMIVKNEGSDSDATIYMDGQSQDFTLTSKQDGKVSGLKINLGEDSPMGSMMNSQEMSDQIDANGTYADCDFQRTNQQQVINGYASHLFQSTCPDGDKVDIWVADELDLGIADLFPVNGPGMDRMRQEMGMAGIDGFIMKLESTDKNGKVEGFESMVKERSVSSHEVSVPADVNALDMDDMIMEMMKAQNDPEKLKELQEQLEMFKDLSDN